MGDLEPITRNEKLWSGEDLTPVTRREMYIKHLYDETQVIPEYPVTREEMFILKAGEELHDVTIEQLTATENKTYSEEGVAYSPVIVNVPLPENAYLLKEIEDVEIATFTDGSDLPMPKLEVAIEPVQDLHGYDAPWVGGAGKNKANIADMNVQSQTTMGKLTLPSGTYVASATVKNNTSIGGAIKINTSSETLALGEIPSASGTSRVSTASFTLSESTEIVVVVSGALSGYNYDVSQVQIESGSTATTFAPYSNICPISGWDEVNVGDVGKNLVNWKWNTFNDGKMEIFLKGGTYTLSAESALTNGNAYIRGTKPSGEYVSREELGLIDWGASSTSGVYYGGGGQQTYTFNIPNGGAKIEFGKLNNNGTINAQLEVGSQATAYEPYNGSTITIQLGDTYYGGKLRIINGVVDFVADRVEVIYDGSSDENWIYTSSLNRVYVYIPNAKKGTSGSVLPIQSNLLHYSQGVREDYGAHINDQGNLIVFAPNDIADANTWKTWLASNNVQVVYELATPLTIQLTPTVVKSLKGKNNVYADSGNILDLSYLAKEE